MRRGDAPVAQGSFLLGWGLGRWLGRGGSVRYSLGPPPFTSFLPLSRTFVKSIFLQHFPFLPCFFSTRALCSSSFRFFSHCHFSSIEGGKILHSILKRLCNSIKSRDVSFPLRFHWHTRVFTQNVRQHGQFQLEL